MFNSKVFLAEFIGTFALVFIGMGAGIVNAGLLGVALAHGFTLAVFAYAYGHISGTHVNPAVTFALALKNVVTWGQAVVYWIAQFAGAILAAFVMKLFLDSSSYFYRHIAASHYYSSIYFHLSSICFKYLSG